MNLIGQIFANKPSSKPGSPVMNKLRVVNETTPERHVDNGSWSSKMFTKVKECRDVIRDIIKPEKTPFMSGPLNKNTNQEPVVTPKRITVSTPDIITSSKISINGSREEPIVKYSKLASNEDNSPNHRLSISMGTACNVDNTSNSLNYTGQGQTNDSLMSFLALERQVEQKFPWPDGQRRSPSRQEHDKKDTLHDRSSSEDESENSLEGRDIPLGRKKISVEPFLSSARQSELFWDEDDSLPEKVWNYLNSSDVMFEDTCGNSTFHEEAEIRRQKQTGGIPVEDSGFVNNDSLLPDTVQ